MLNLITEMGVVEQYSFGDVSLKEIIESTTTRQIGDSLLDKGLEMPFFYHDEAPVYLPK